MVVQGKRLDTDTAAELHDVLAASKGSRACVCARASATLGSTRAAPVDGFSPRPFAGQAAVATLHGWSLTDDLATIETDAGNLEIADPEHVERYLQHTRLLLDTAITGTDAAALCRHINSEAPGNFAAV
jgi:hypothetical protein